jgi:hypothetical protein
MAIPAFRTHFGDPCIHCAIAHDDVAPGPCLGDPTKAIVLAYRVTRQAWQNPVTQCDTIACLMSTSSIVEMARYPSEHWPHNDQFRNARSMTATEFAAATRRLP